MELNIDIQLFQFTGPAARAHPNCLKAVAAATKVIESSLKLVQGSELNLQVPYVVQSLLNTEHTHHFLVD